MRLLRSFCAVGALVAVSVGIWFSTGSQKNVLAQSCAVCSGEPPFCDSGVFCNQSTGQWECGPESPILIDLVGDGFRLTDVADGVRFDLRGRGVRDLIAWTAPAVDDAWLALDRNGNGAINDGRELFGDATEQPPPPAGEIRNGFLALQVFDGRAAGGNQDGVISPGDAVFSKLTLWQDRNHNGVSETGELLNLMAAGIGEIDLKYHESKKTDEFGNRFRFRAKVRSPGRPAAAKWAWDVFLQIANVEGGPVPIRINRSIAQP